MNAEKVGAAIAFLRKRVGYTQKELADRIGVTDKAVSKWERGLGLPDTAIIGKLAILLDTDTDSLLAGDLIHHNKDWIGLLILDENVNGIYSGTIIFDKPLVYFQLGYFMLMGIKNIWVVSHEKDKKFIKSEFGSGEHLGIKLSYFDNIPKEKFIGHDMNVMIVMGRSFLYGVDQTRFFQKAMLQKDKITVLSLPKKISSSPSRVYFNSDKKIVSENDGEYLKTQYDYYQIPILFCSAEFIRTTKNSLDPYKAISEAIKNQVIHTVILDRGFVEITVDSWDDVLNLSMFVKAVQQACGMQIYCIEEIAWRRGLISHDDFIKIGINKCETDYGKYIIELAETNHLR